MSPAWQSEYDLAIWDPDQVVSIEGAELVNPKLVDLKKDSALVRIKYPLGESNSYVTQAITFHFRAMTSRKRPRPTRRSSKAWADRLTVFFGTEEWRKKFYSTNCCLCCLLRPETPKEAGAGVRIVNDLLIALNKF